MIKKSKFIQIFKVPINLFLDFLLNLLDGYGWRAFLARLLLVLLSFVLNPFNSAIQQFTTGAIKLFVLTCAILAYAICKLIYDYSKAGKEAETKKRNNKE